MKFDLNYGQVKKKKIKVNGDLLPESWILEVNLEMTNTTCLLHAKNSVFYPIAFKSYHLHKYTNGPEVLFCVDAGGNKVPLSRHI